MIERPGHSPIVIVGPLNADLAIRTTSIPQPGQTGHGSDLQIRAGGKGPNQAVAAALLGGDVALIGCVGEDEHGRMLLCRMPECTTAPCRRSRPLPPAQR